MDTRKHLWRWRRNDLRRRSDKVERAVRAAATLFALVAAPAAGVAAAGAVGDHLAASAAAQSGAVHRVDAVVRQDTPCVWSVGSVGGSSCSAPAQWRAPDGSYRTGVVQVARTTGKGSTVQIWLDDNGNPTEAPPSAAQTRGDVLSVGVGAGSGAVAIAWLGCRTTTAVLDRRRYRQWEREWAEVGPQWTRRTI